VHSYLNTLDNSPGVYRMLDSEMRVLYVGKARSLKKRVSNYANPMRDDKSFPNILVTKHHDFPQIKKHRGAKREKGDYYGPFASAGAVNRTLNQLQRAFLLRDCSDSEFETRSRPCLQYQIKRCSAPCVGKVSSDEYRGLVKDAQRFLSGRSTDMQAQLKVQMAEASENMEFERAAALRDRIRALTQVQTAQGINPQTVAEADVISLHLARSLRVKSCCRMGSRMKT